jgi:hypothetical protein
MTFRHFSRASAAWPLHRAHPRLRDTLRHARQKKIALLAHAFRKLHYRSKKKRDSLELEITLPGGYPVVANGTV